MTAAKLISLRPPPVVLITGCGSGLGQALAKKLYFKTNYRVIATARSECAVLALQSDLPETERFLVKRLDVTQNDQREELVSSILAKWKSIDILVNNAGISYRSVIEHMDDESELAQLDVNYLSPMALIRLVIPSMRERGFGKIINISSVSGMIAMPTMASYSASKHALEGASEALWYELRPYGISVTVVQPGFIRSNSFEKVYYSKKASLSRSLEGPYSEYYTNIGPFVENLMRRSWSNPDDIAGKILKLFGAGSTPLWLPVTFDALVFFLLRKVLPRTIFHKFMANLLPMGRTWGLRFKRRPPGTYLLKK